MSVSGTVGDVACAVSGWSCVAGRREQVSDTWSWRPRTDAWFARLYDTAEQWRPSPSLGLDAWQLRRLIQKSAARCSTWLIHPCASALTLRTAQNKLQSDFQLVVWLALNTGEQLGVAYLEEPTWVWSPGGSTRLAAGHHDLSALAVRLGGSQGGSPVAIDAWGHTTNVQFHQLWRDLTPFGPPEQETLKTDLMLLCRALGAAEKHLPSCFQWAISRTKVVVPMRRISGEHSSSSSASDLPGVVFLTLHHEVQTLDAFVHESAHQHLFMAESAGALVDPSHTALYKSPLRNDPRPLRGILLAWHALAYIAAYYADALAASLAAAAGLAKNLEETRRKLADAQSILLANRAHLTRYGREFVDQTADLARYSA